MMKRSLFSACNNKMLKLNQVSRSLLGKTLQSKAWTRLMSAQQQAQTSQSVEVEKHEERSSVDPFKHVDFFGTSNLVSIRELFDARVHLGHKEGTLNEHMKPYIVGSRLGQVIIDLDQTVIRMREALNFAAHIAYRNGLILFVNSSRQTGHIVELAARDVGEYAHCNDWNRGTFTNSESFFDSVTRLPDLVILPNSMSNVFTEHPAVADSAKMLIPTIAVVDTACDPTLVSYPVPGNDDTPCAIKLYCNLFSQAIKLGKAKRQEMLEKFGTV
ncbi:28S ribosomal protein S2, mitochondrial [Halotydeus destructor]|nr:28S ribosomal protein S2, mitochondrial [Halotydeus destructor]